MHFFSFIFLLNKMIFSRRFRFYLVFSHCRHLVATFYLCKEFYLDRQSGSGQLKILNHGRHYFKELDILVTILSNL